MAQQTMTATSTPRRVIAPNYTGPRLFGAPVGDFSFLQTLLITVASGFVVFFATTFLSIVTILILTQFAHKQIDFAIAYKWFGAPAGVLMWIVAGGYLGSLLVMRLRNKTSRV